MNHVPSNPYQPYRDQSQEQARALLQQMDETDPSWMIHRIPTSHQKQCFLHRWFISEDFFSNSLVPTVCTVVVLCLLISATTTRLTAQTIRIEIQNSIQDEISSSFHR